MVYPAVNAFTASEPGTLTKSLCEMNNFVSYDSRQDDSYHGCSEVLPRQQLQVTPEAKPRDVHSPQSSLSTTQSIGPITSLRHGQMALSGMKRSSMQFFPPEEARPEKRLYVKSLVLRPEHYRAVTPRSAKDKNDLDGYHYPHVSLTFQERKRLSDTLFFLSKEMPNVAVHVASLLRVSREKDEWDLSVAELLTQVVVGLFCMEGDHRLDGLRDYLLRLGVSC